MYIAIYPLFLLILFGCNTTHHTSDQSISKDNKYDSEFPSESVSDELDYISRGVKKLDILAFYATYYFPQDSSVSLDVINDSVLDIYSEYMTITHESVSGTAFVIYDYDNILGLLTCAHVIDFKDTVFSYYGDKNNQLQTLSIKIKQQNHVSGLPSGEPIEIAAVNREKDIALLMKKTVPNDQIIHTINNPRGSISDLQWGSIVYIMGYPLGNLMVTRAIVSITEKMKSGIFVTDALYNHGISGSPVFGMRDGATNFELIGMASSSAAQASNIIVPESDIKIDNNIKAPYTGKLFVDNNKLISYGVTYSVSIDEISTFITTNEKALISNGFIINNFFN